MKMPVNILYTKRDVQNMKPKHFLHSNAFLRTRMGLEWVIGDHPRVPSPLPLPG